MAWAVPLAFFLRGSDSSVTSSLRDVVNPGQPRPVHEGGKPGGPGVPREPGQQTDTVSASLRGKLPESTGYPANPFPISSKPAQFLRGKLPESTGYPANPLPYYQ